MLCGSKYIDGDGEYDFVWWALNTPDDLRYDQISLVLCVVMNRVRSESFPNTVTDVVLARGQFEVMPKNASTTPHDIAIEIVREWCEAYDRWDTVATQTVPENHLYFSSGPNKTNVSRAKFR